MADPAQEALNRATLTFVSSESDLDSPTLRCHLSEAGHGRSLDLLLTDSLYSRAPFARPGAPLDRARDGWREVWRRYGNRRLQEEVQAATHALGLETSEANLARLKALRLQAERDGGGEEAEYF